MAFKYSRYPTDTSVTTNSTSTSIAVNVSIAVAVHSPRHLATLCARPDLNKRQRGCSTSSLNQHRTLADYVGVHSSAADWSTVPNFNQDRPLDNVNNHGNNVRSGDATISLRWFQVGAESTLTFGPRR